MKQGPSLQSSPTEHRQETAETLWYGINFWLCDGLQKQQGIYPFLFHLDNMRNSLDFFP